MFTPSLRSEQVSVPCRRENPRARGRFGRRSVTRLCCLLLVTWLGSISAHADSPAARDVIKHVIVVFQENRTPDNLFHGLRNADIADYGVNSEGKSILLEPQELGTDYDIFHRHADFVAMYNDGKMDGADKIPTKCGRYHPDCIIPPLPQFKYVKRRDVAPYFQMAAQYTFGDRMFQTNQGPSFPAHQVIISGTSAPAEDSKWFVAEGPIGIPDAQMDTGCTAPPEEFVKMIHSESGKWGQQYPCFEHQTLMDLLDAKDINWRYYTVGPRGQWTAPNAIYHLRFGPDWDGKVVMEPTRILTDIAEGRLRPVSWVIPQGRYSDHSGGNEGEGPSWVASIVNAIGESPYWSNTAILITWDDWGGWYDHVPPKIINTYEYGFRVPLLVVSPYAKPGYVSHVTHDFGSILKFVEKVYGLPSLGYADELADDLSDCFDFAQAPLKFERIIAPLDASYFLTTTGLPSADPDED